jgi:NAD(P)-dependent dehydrogenase (short-subunit alcohol dehydrogenase family)
MPDTTSHLALVTGAAKRLGKAIALRLAAEGCDIVVHYNSSAADADLVVSDVQSLGRKAMAVAFDQSDDDAIDLGMAEIIRQFGRAPDVLVNCASIFEWDNLSTVDRAALARHFETNLFGPVLLTRHVAAAATAATRGLIINLLDQKLFNPNPDHLAYTLSKYALQGFTTLMATDLAPRFRVCAIAPGHTLPGPDETGAHFDAVHDQTPLLRGPTPNDIAGAAAYLLNSPAITGQTLIVDGGSFLNPAPRDIAFR